MGNAAQNEDVEVTSPSMADTMASRSLAEARASELGGRSRGSRSLRLVSGYRSEPDRK